MNTKDLIYIKKKIIGTSIIKCERIFFSFNKDLHEFELNNDGDVYLSFSNNLILSIVSDTTNFSIKLSLGEDSNKISTTDISNNPSLIYLLNEGIIDIIFLYTEYQINPYGIKFIFENEKSLIVKYISENEYVFDSLIIEVIK
ncbi:hypothetical protein [Empedobacter tilapiae]